MYDSKATELKGEPYNSTIKFGDDNTHSHLISKCRIHIFLSMQVHDIFTMIEDDKTVPQ